MVTVEIQLKTSYDSNGAQALSCWYALDTHGKKMPCREPELLDKALSGKASWNLQIKMWAETVAEGLLFQEELFEYCYGLPRWITRATLNQSQKIFKEKYGWTPRFCRDEYMLGNLWLPYMDSFAFDI